MINPDDLDPQRPVLQPLDLQQMSIAELNNYIASLQAEISRTEKAIAQKVAHKSGAEGLFNF